MRTSARPDGMHGIHAVVVLIAMTLAGSGSAADTRRWCMNRQCSIGSPPIDLHPLPIEKESGRPSSAIRFRMLHAISASVFCDSG
jgi:hypothetical protein